MKLPKVIKILYRDYKVVPYTAQEASTDGNLGVFKPDQALMKVDQQWGSKKQANILLHELLHAIFYEMAIDTKSAQSEESVILPLANGFSAVMRDNPGLLLEIQKALR